MDASQTLATCVFRPGRRGAERRRALRHFVRDGARALHSATRNACCLELFWYFSDAYAAESPGLHDLPTSDGTASGRGLHPRSEPRLHSAHSRGGCPVDRVSSEGLAYPKEPTLEHPPGVKWWREVPLHRQRIWRRGLAFLYALHQRWKKAP